MFDNPMFSNSPGSVTNNGYSSAWGFGARVGYMGQLTDYLVDRRRLLDQDRHGQLRRLQGPVRAGRRLRHPVELHPRRRGPADRPVAAGARLRAHLLRRRAVGEQSSWRTSTPACRRDGRPGPSQQLPRRQQRRRLRLGEHRRLEVRRPVPDGRQVDVPRRLQPHATTRSRRRTSPSTSSPRAWCRTSTPWARPTRSTSSRQITGAFMYAAENSVTGPSLFAGFLQNPGGDRDHRDEAVPVRRRLLAAVLTARAPCATPAAGPTGGMTQRRGPRACALVLILRHAHRPRRGAHRRRRVRAPARPRSPARSPAWRRVRSPRRRRRSAPA